MSKLVSQSSKKSLQPCCDIASLPSEGRQGAKIPNISAGVHAAGIILIISGFPKVGSIFPKIAGSSLLYLATIKAKDREGKRRQAQRFVQKYLLSKSRLYSNIGELVQQIRGNCTLEPKKQAAKFQLQAVQTNCRRFLAFVCRGDTYVCRRLGVLIRDAP